MGEAVAQGMSHDEFGGNRVTIGGAQPTSKEAPDGAMVEDGQVLEQPLDDEADLNVTLIGSHFASDLRPVEFALAMEVLVAWESAFVVNDNYFSPEEKQSSLFSRRMPTASTPRRDKESCLAGMLPCKSMP